MRKVISCSSVFLCLLIIGTASVVFAEDRTPPSAEEAATSPEANSDQPQLTEVETLLARAEKLFRSFHEDFNNLKAAQSLLQKALKIEPDNYLIALTLSRVHLSIGDHLEKTDEKKIKRFELAKSWAERARTLKRTAETEYWIGANLGRIGETRGVLNSLFMVPQLEKQLNAALSLDPNHTMSITTFSDLQYQLPWPKGDNDRALEYAEKALKIDPNLTYAMVMKLKILVKMGRDAEAKKYAQQIVDFKNPTYPMYFYTNELADAKEILKELSE